ncbi:U4/U6.U5 tri-snRNP-associated protein isoform 3 [Schistosoma japonicum]|uniref:U4/U6.U5 tri-snRNP-associated protein isoform 3 n=1 Tax=Schistosoma japonicum TaxID=6182 RepID=A0A4Z2D1S1_SCHJA|nr:U4/U6.U5 tri-snRNP-associated protein 1 [Schistosoma japonicum]TNN10424.1 U4/U6.U5 tri-snRNP-associated protein isoform 3 [Schistosoma japonicum]
MTRGSPNRSHKKHRHKNRERSRSPLNQIPDRNFNRHDEYSTGDTGGTGVDISLSVAETNALRAKLGLAPLDTDDTSKSKGTLDNQADCYIHAPAKDIRKTKESEAIKEKLNVLKEKRLLLDKIGQEKLSIPAEHESDVQSWIEKMREKERIQKQAEERAKLLSEIDDQLSVSEFVEPRLIMNDKKYKSEDLAGLRVEHSSTRFVDGQSVILTIKDSGVLDESEDVLVNVNIADDEKADLYKENSRKTAGLAGIDDLEDEEVLLGLRSKAVLSKYDSEISGIKKDHFVIDSGGTYNTENERLLKQLQAELKEGRQSLPDTELRIASEYYSTEEMATKFKKRKRRVKTIRQALTADELQNELLEQSSTSDLGSRSMVKENRISNDISSVNGKYSTEDLSAQLVDVKASYEEDWSAEVDHIDEADELRSELEKTIGRVIQSKSRAVAKPEEITSQLLAKNTATHSSQSISQSLVSDTSSSSNKKDSVVFDSTAEFYKSIGIGFQESMKRNARYNQFLQNQSTLHNNGEAVDVNDSDLNLSPPTRLPYKEEEEEEQKYDHDSESNYRTQSEDYDINYEDTNSDASKDRWHTVGNDGLGSSTRTVPKPTVKKSEQGSIKVENTDIHGVLDDEPRLDSGVFSAIRLAEKKGYIDKEKEKRTGSGTMVNLMAKHFVQEDIRYDDIDAKFYKRDRYSGPLSDFKELTQYKPDIKLEYVDELGRDLSAKEAFRQLSHKFHGKGSGKNKTQKRMKKINEEFLLKASTSSDTPLGTVNKLNKKLEAMSMPYVILSGKNAAV